MSLALADKVLQTSTPSDCVQTIQFFNDVLEGLNKPQKALSPKYFYDDAGSHYFDEICKLKEYYPYRTELSLLPQIASELEGLLGSPCAVIEFGAGALAKISPLLNNVSAIKHFVPIDISGDYLRASTALLKERFPSVEMTPVEADFTQPVALPALNGLQKMGFFPGSTIGNFTPDAAIKFLRNAAETLGNNAFMLIGVDTKKSPNILHKAYNDSLGVTGDFNKNVLTRMNCELNADFDVNCFDHYAFYNPSEGCVEMHLVSQCAQQVNLDAHTIHFRAGESIHTESSYKYAPEQFTRLVHEAGWVVNKQWLALDEMFSVFLLRAQ